MSTNDRLKSVKWFLKCRKCDRQTDNWSPVLYKWIAYKLSETTTGDMFFLNEEMNVNGA